MKIAAQTVDVEDIISKVLTKVFPEDHLKPIQRRNNHESRPSCKND